jgi:hypothetical protein
VSRPPSKRVRRFITKGISLGHTIRRHSEEPPDSTAVIDTGEPSAVWDRAMPLPTWCIERGHARSIRPNRVAAPTLSRCWQHREAAARRSGSPAKAGAGSHVPRGGLNSPIGSAERETSSQRGLLHTTFSVNTSCTCRASIDPGWPSSSSRRRGSIGPTSTKICRGVIGRGAKTLGSRSRASQRRRWSQTKHCFVRGSRSVRNQRPSFLPHSVRRPSPV